MSAEALVAACLAQGITLATAESLTAGLVGAAIADVPGCSAIFRGGVIAYDSSIKASVLSLPVDLLDDVVSGEVAAAMAEGACAVMDARLGLATTGVAGPGDWDGHPAGTVWVGVCLDGKSTTRELAIPGDRATVRAGAVQAVLALAVEALG